MYKKAALYLKFPVALFAYAVSKISAFAKRDDKKWVFGCHTGYGDNPKFLLYHIQKTHQELRPIWITHSRGEISRIRALGIECYYWLSVKGFYNAATAGVFVCTQSVRDVNRFVSEGAVYLNLNHGVGLKKGFWLNKQRFEKLYGKSVDELEKSFVFKVINYIWLYRRPDLSLVTSDFQAREIFAPQFKIPLTNCIFGNYPRNEILKEDKNDILRIVQRYEPFSTLSFIEKCKGYDKVFIYMPTFRNDGCDFISASGMDFQVLNDVLKQINALLVLKFHPRTQLNVGDISSMSNITFFNKESDVYYFLPFTDCLITDYSSIYCDYLILNKEIILFPFDKEEYIKKSMDLADYDYYYRGPKAETFTELWRLIKDKVDCHLQKNDYDFVMKVFWDSIDSNIDIVNEVNKRLNTKKE